MGLSFEGLEKEVVDLFKRIERRRGLGGDLVESNSLIAKKLRNELKKLESTINYDARSGGSHERSVRHGKGNMKCI